MAQDLINTSNPTLVSVPSTDLEEGFGNVPYYLFSSENSSGVTYHIGKSAYYSSSDIILAHTTAGSPATQTWVFNSGLFQLPRVMEGTAIFNFDLKGAISGGETCVATIQIFHVTSDGATETQQGSTWTSASLPAGATTSEIQTAQIVLPRKPYTRGEYFRMKVAITNSENADESQIGCDPQNRDAPGGSAWRLTPSTNANETTIFSGTIPFRQKD